jgi:hypothetical protein
MTEEAQNGPAVKLQCAKRGHMNRAGLELCEQCGRHLYVYCACGEKVVRLRQHCPTCGDQLRTWRHPDVDLRSGRMGTPIGHRDMPPPGSQLAAAVMMFGAIEILGLGVSGVVKYLDNIDKSPFNRVVEEGQKTGITVGWLFLCCLTMGSILALIAFLPRRSGPI